MKPHRTTSTTATSSPKAPKCTPTNGIYPCHLSLSYETHKTWLTYHQGHHTRRNHFPDPEVYNPDRWLNPAYPTFQEPLSQYPSIKGFTTFGYGRRICQGMDLVEQELLIGIGNMAWAGSFRNKRDALGREIHNPAHDYTALLISRPKPLVFDLKPRSAERAAAIKQRWAAGREAEGTDRSEKGMVGLESAFVSRPPRDIGNLLSEKVEDQIQVERLTMEV